MNKVNILFVLIIISAAGCTQGQKKVYKQTTALSTYFETSDVDAKEINRNFEISVSNSRLVIDKRKKMGRKWASAEAIASVGGVIALSLLDSNKSISDVDTIALSIQVDGRNEKYSYSVDELKQVSKEVDVCKEFSEVISKDSLQRMKQFFSDQILKTTSDKELDKFLLDVFAGLKPSRIELAGFKILNGISSVYTNFYYDDGSAQTYVFSFALGQNKIGGITLPGR